MSVYRFGLLAVLLFLLGVFSCSKTIKIIQKENLTKRFRIDPNTTNGLIYGKIIHNRLFGNKFMIKFKNLKTNLAYYYSIQSYGETDTSKNLFFELPPGEWNIDQIILESGTIYDPTEIRGQEVKEFIVYRSDITYVGTWQMSTKTFKVLNEKDKQDFYMRLNYKNVMTANALTILP